MVDITELAARLGDSDQKAKLSAARDLTDAAAQGADITIAIPALMNALSDKDEEVWNKAADALSKAIMNHKSRDAALSEVKCALSGDTQTRWKAAVVLWRAIDKGADIPAAIPALANALSDAVEAVREMAVEALTSAVARGADITPAIPALVHALSDENANVRRKAAYVLGHSMFYGANITAAISALAKALSDENADVRTNADEALRIVIDYCSPIDRYPPKILSEMEAMVLEELRASRKKFQFQTKGELAAIGLQFSALLNKIAKRRNIIAAKRDMLLTDKPKPPKFGKGQIYCRMRRVANG
jgi:HEAT repeat protein